MRTKEARIAVIGLGYVDLPVASCFAKAGFDVLGIDILEERAEKINRGENPIEGDGPGLVQLPEAVIDSGNLRASSDYAVLQDRDVVLIAVETPVDEQHQPQYQALRSVLTSLAPRLKDGALVIVESTISPSTMLDLVQVLLEGESGKKANEDFCLGNCPDRVMPDKLLHNLRNEDRVVGGKTLETADTTMALYRHVVEGDLEPTDCITAELVKTTENAYRDVQKAFANEVALICVAVGGDVWKVRELVNKSPDRYMLLPGAGVGGHCIPQNPWLLAHAIDDKDVPLRLIPAARAVNDDMPFHMADLLEGALHAMGKPLGDAQILVMGYAYLKNSDDSRNSPSATLVEELHCRGATTVVHDPYIAEYHGNLLAMSQGCDAAVLMVKHDEYNDTELGNLNGTLKLRVLVDGRGFYESAWALEAGFRFYQLGKNWIA